MQPFQDLFKRRARSLLFALAVAFVICPPGADAAGPYLATGIKIGEVSDSTAIVWLRLTRNAERVPFDAGIPAVMYRDDETGELVPREGRGDLVPVVTFPDGLDVETIEGACPGMMGEFRVQYRARGASTWEQTNWHAVAPEWDYTRQISLTGLAPGTAYELRVATRAHADSPEGAAIAGSFRTAPARNTAAPVTFTVTTGTAYPDRDSPEGYKIYGEMLKLDPDFFVHTGDILYYDNLAKTLPLARWHWQRMYSLPSNIAFHRQVASYFIKDDHDTWMNDCWPTRQTRFMGEFTFAQGLADFPHQVPMSTKTYRTFRWGKDLQVWFVEGRDFRSPNDMPDGPEKTIWGAEQMAWFKRTVEDSDATFRLLVSPTPVVGPDRTRKSDNHSNAAFTREGDEVRAFIASQKNMAVVCGDRHWQYVSVHEPTGVKEYSCGPASNEHAGGWSNDQRYPEHQYLNVIGGFLAITVDRADGLPTLTARHYSVDGQVLNEDSWAAK